MSDVCPCHGKPWMIRNGGRGRTTQRVCAVKRRESQRAADARYSATSRGRESSRLSSARGFAREQLARENRTKRLGKLLNLSVNGATEHERRLARQKYNQLKGVKVA